MASDLVPGRTLTATGSHSQPTGVVEKMIPLDAVINRSPIKKLPGLSKVTSNHSQRSLHAHCAESQQALKRAGLGDKMEAFQGLQPVNFVALGLRLERGCSGLEHPQGVGSNRGPAVSQACVLCVQLMVWLQLWGESREVQTNSCGCLRVNRPVAASRTIARCKQVLMT